MTGGGAATGGGLATGGGANGTGGGSVRNGNGAEGPIPQLPPLRSVGTLIVLGDSIGDGGGNPPFYYNLLREGLNAKFPGLTYVHKAKSGSSTDNLPVQVDSIAGPLPAPVVVVITSGGNDMRYSAPLIALGQDSSLWPTFRSHIKSALDKLLAPGRFGAGVDVHV